MSAGRLVVLLGELWQGSGRQGGCVFGGRMFFSGPTRQSSGTQRAALTACFINMGVRFLSPLTSNVEPSKQARQFLPVANHGKTPPHLQPPIRPQCEHLARSARDPANQGCCHLPPTKPRAVRQPAGPHRPACGCRKLARRRVRPHRPRLAAAARRGLVAARGCPCGGGGAGRASARRDERRRACTGPGGAARGVGAGSGCAVRCKLEGQIRRGIAPGRVGGWCAFGRRVTWWSGLIPGRGLSPRTVIGNGLGA